MDRLQVLEEANTGDKYENIILEVENTYPGRLLSRVGHTYPGIASRTRAWAATHIYQIGHFLFLKVN